MDYLGRREFAEALNISYTTLDNWLRKGYVKPAYETPTGRKFFSSEQVTDFYNGKLGRGDNNEIV